MNSIFPVSELAVMVLFAAGLVWLVVEVMRQEPAETLAAMLRKTEVATQRGAAFRRRAGDDAGNRFQSSSIC